MSTNGEVLSAAYLEQQEKLWRSNPWWLRCWYRVRTWWEIRVVLKIKLEDRSN